MRADLSGDPSFLELLGRVRKTVLGAQANQDLPFERLVDALHVPRSLSHTPLYQVMLTLEEEEPDLCRLHGLDVRRMKTSTYTSAFDLTLELVAMKDGSLEAVFEYSTDLFAGETIVRMAGHFKELLGQVVLNPDARVSELPMLSQSERRQLLLDWNDTAASDPRESGLHELFEAQARLTPDAAALICEGTPYSYRVLNKRANQLAHYLRRQGIATESRVALCMERSLEMVTAMLGTLKAGAAYVPMDPLYPRERLNFMIQDSGAQLLLTQRRFVEHVHRPAVPTIALDETWSALAAMPDINGLWPTIPENLAYVLYTSGTTGEPKGIEISHGALINHSIAMSKHYGLRSADRVLQFASISFDVAAEECFPTWRAGATVVLRPNEPVPEFADFQRFVEDHKLTVLNLPTPYWAEWIGEIEQHGTAIPHSIRLVIVGSEKALPDSLIRWQRLASDRVAWCNSYGPTEATITASFFVPEGQTNWTSASTVPIGRPIANVQLYVLDQAMQPAPIGVAGELYIGGMGLARGYHLQPSRTADAFIPHCFADEPGARLYRTGDKVRRRADGNLEFLGRYDDQIKIRGFRIEPAEIECRLKQHPSVKEARVLQELPNQPDAPRDATAQPRLVGYVVLHAGATVTAQELRHFLVDRLPAYMIPGAWVILDAFPLTSRGKVDRQALRTLSAGIQKTESVVAPLQTDTERAIVEIWKNVLGLQDVGRHDNFFDLGGHSLLLGKVLAQVRSLSSRPLVMMDLFQYPTVQMLAAYVSGEGSSMKDRDSSSPVEQAQRARERRAAGTQRLKRQREQRRTTTREL
ncbi:MAG: amino acid adenylation domain-containing protein [Nitrospira sp.]